MDNSERLVLEVHHDDGKLIEGILNEAEKNIDNSDEAMVVGEVISNPKQTFAKCVDKEEEEDDDDEDCVILDGDPDKPVAIEHNGGNDSGDLCLVGEKGHVFLMDHSARFVMEIHHDDGILIEDVLNEAEKNIDDSDEAMVVGEVISSPKQTFATCVDNEEEEEDDDCVILDGDPDKPVAIENNGGNNSGDVCLVGEKGQRFVLEVHHDYTKLIEGVLNEAQKNINDSDEAMVVGEVIPKPKQTFAKCVENEEEEEDECVILDGDPDKPVATEHNGGNDSGDLCLGGEKGQVFWMDNSGRFVLEVRHDDGRLIEGVLNEAEKNIDDSNEAMVVGEIIPNPKQTFAKCVDNEEEEDNDCVILEGNPHKPVAIENNGGNDSGDLCLVGEKGRVFLMDNSERFVLEVHHDDDKLIEGVLNEAEKNIDDSDQAMLVEEVISNPKQTFAKCVDNEEEEEDDDDCVILDGDPDKPVAIENNGGNDSGDLCLVSEKGQVACRDYPHSRHLCVKFTFNSTPHEKHCDKCYCYVCDSVAPCVHWGNGTSNTDHCHATEKDAFWEAQRKGAKTSHKAPSFVSEVGLSTMNQVPSLHSNPLMHNQELPTGLPCSVASTGTPTRAYSGGVSTNSVPNSSVQLPVGIGIGNYAPLQPQVYPHRHSGSVIANSVTPHPQLSSQTCLGSNLGKPIPIAPGVSSQQRWENRLANPMSLHSQAGSHPNVYQDAVPCLPNRPHPQSFSQTCMGSNLGNPAPIAPGVSTKQRWIIPIVNPMSLHSQAGSHPNVCQNAVPCLPNPPHLQSFSQTCMGSNLGNPVPIAPGVSTQQKWRIPIANPMSLHSQAGTHPNAYPTDLTHNLSLRHV